MEEEGYVRCITALADEKKGEKRARACLLAVSFCHLIISARWKKGGFMAPTSCGENSQPLVFFFILEQGMKASGGG